MGLLGWAAGGVLLGGGEGEDICVLSRLSVVVVPTRSVYDGFYGVSLLLLGFRGFMRIQHDFKLTFLILDVQLACPGLGSVFDNLIVLFCFFVSPLHHVVTNNNGRTNVD